MLRIRELILAVMLQTCVAGSGSADYENDDVGKQVASGRKISPAKVEAALLATGLVRAVKVHGLPSKDPERFEEIAAKVELNDGVTLETLKSAATEKLQPWEMPRHWGGM